MLYILLRPSAMHVDFGYCFCDSSYFNLTILCGKMWIRFHQRFKSALFTPAFCHCLSLPVLWIMVHEKWNIRVLFSALLVYHFGCVFVWGGVEWNGWWWIVNVWPASFFWLVCSVNVNEILVGHMTCCTNEKVHVFYCKNGLGFLLRVSVHIFHATHTLTHKPPFLHFFLELWWWDFLHGTHQNEIIPF